MKKINISLAILNKDGVCASIESSDDCFDSMRLVESYSCSPQEACRRAAKHLRKAAKKFDALSEYKREKIFKRKTHEKINKKNDS